MGAYWVEERHHALNNLMKTLIHIYNCREMMKEELDMVILSKLSVLTPVTYDGDQRKLNKTQYMSKGKIICRKVFLFLHDIIEKHYKAIQEHF